PLGDGLAPLFGTSVHGRVRLLTGQQQDGRTPDDEQPRRRHREPGGRALGDGEGNRRLAPGGLGLRPGARWRGRLRRLGPLPVRHTADALNGDEVGLRREWTERHGELGDASVTLLPLLVETARDDALQLRRDIAPEGADGARLGGQDLGAHLWQGLALEPAPT